MEFNDWLAAKKAEFRLSNKAIADACGVTPGAVGRWLRGERMPERAQVVALALLFRVSAVTILRMTDRAELLQEEDTTKRQQSMAELLTYVPELAEFVELLWKMPPERRAALILLARSMPAEDGSK